jgi:uncharacterized protein (DUF1778 family)
MNTNVGNDHLHASKVPRRTRRLRLRLREHELSKLSTVAAQRGQYVAEFVRDASLAAAQAVMDSVNGKSGS